MFDDVTFLFQPQGGQGRRDKGGEGTAQAARDRLPADCRLPHGDRPQVRRTLTGQSSSQVSHLLKSVIF